jgi:CRISPR/Cas system CSM-associated protein Csm2 small subunit
MTENPEKIPKKENKKSNFLHSKPALFVLIILLGIFAYNLSGIIKKVNDTKDNRDQAIRKREILLEQQASLSSEIDHLKTDEGKEELIREKFRAVKENEGLVVILPETQDINSDTDKSQQGFGHFFKRIFTKSK